MLSLLLLAAAAASDPFAPSTLATPISPAPPVTQARMDVPQDKGPQQVVIQTRAFTKGQSAGWHIHHGVETVCLAEGSLEFSIGTNRPMQLGAGQCLSVPREVPHSATGTSTVPARLVITLMVDKGPPLREAVPDPGR